MDPQSAGEPVVDLQSTLPSSGALGSQGPALGLFPHLWREEYDGDPALVGPLREPERTARRSGKMPGREKGDLGAGVLKHAQELSVCSRGRSKAKAWNW